MKKVLLASLCLILLGVVLTGAAFAMGARFSDTVITGLHFGSGLNNINSEVSADGCYELSDQDISTVDINWTNGEVHIIRSSDGKISFRETCASPISDDQALRWRAEHGVLVIYNTDNRKLLTPEKALTLALPDAAVKDLRVASTSASVSACDLTAENIKIETISGNVLLEDTYGSLLETETTSGSIQAAGSYRKAQLDTTSGEIFFEAGTGLTDLSMNTTSGDINFTGTFQVGNIETASGDVQLTLSDGFHEAKVDTTSGSLTICHPENVGYRIDFDTASGELVTDEPIVLQGNEVRIGDGSGTLSFDSSSGDLNIGVIR